MQTRLIELTRKLENMLRLGVVAEVKQGYCRVRTGNLLLDWRPYCTTRAGSARTSWRPTVGEQVLIMSPGGNYQRALIGPSFYSDDNPQPDQHESRHFIEYPDGAVISYDPETGELKAFGIKTAALVASEKVTVDSPETEIIGNLTVTGKLTVQGESLLQGANQMDSGTSINGDAAISGDATIGGISFAGHVHTGDSGGKTGAAE